MYLFNYVNKIVFNSIGDWICQLKFKFELAFDWTIAKKSISIRYSVINLRNFYSLPMEIATKTSCPIEHIINAPTCVFIFSSFFSVANRKQKICFMCELLFAYFFRCLVARREKIWNMLFVVAFFFTSSTVLPIGCWKN